MSKRPNLIKISGRTHYACTRCKVSKIRCLGEKPACANCRLVKKESQCTYPPRDRKIVIMESDLNGLYSQLQKLEEQVGLAPKDRTTKDMSEALRSSPVSKDLSQEPESTLASQAANIDESIMRNVLEWCSAHIPDRKVAWDLVGYVSRSYSTEMFVVDSSELEAHIESIFSYFAQFKDGHDVFPVSQPPSSISLCYFFAILAFGQQLQNSSATNAAREAVPGLNFYLTACRLFQVNYERIDFVYIQSSILLGLISCNLNRYNTTYNYLGVAVLSAVANGYHRQIPTPAFPDIDSRRKFLVIEEKKKRVWWTLFFIDVIWAARINMPAHIDFTDTDVALPSEMPIDLHDGFDTQMLDSNVQLIKYVAKFNKLIYGPSLRTFSVNYINTDKFNQDRLVKTIISSLNELTNGLEDPLLAQCKDISIISQINRNLANLFFRFNQLIILVVEPLLSIVFNPNSASLVENNSIVYLAIVKGTRAAYTTVNMMYKLFEHGKVFLFGFWDSQHLFSAFTYLLFVLIAGFPYKEHNKIVALLKYMGEHKNMSAKRYLQRIEAMNTYLDSIPEVNLHFSLNADMRDYTPKGISNSGEFYNPLADKNLSSEGFVRFFQRVPTRLLYEEFGFDKFTPQSQLSLWSMTKSIQEWANYSGLPIPISGVNKSTGSVFKNGHSHAKSEFNINDLI